VIDDHVHPFPFEFEPFDLGTLGLDVGVTPDDVARQRRLAPGRLYVHLLETRLATLLGSPLAEVAAHRDELWLTDAGARTAWVEETRDTLFEANAREVYALS